MNKSLKHVLSSASIIIVIAFLATAAGYFYLKSNRLAESYNRAQIRFSRHLVITDQHVQAERSLENKVKELKLTVKRLVSTSNKVKQARPQLVEWVYKHSRISRIMAEEIVDNVDGLSCPLFLLALMKTESNFNPTAISSKGAMGLGQIMPVHKKALKEAGIIEEMRDIFNIPTAIEATEFIWELKMAAAKGDINKALALYLGVKSEKYVNKILKDYFQLNYLCRKPLREQKAVKIQVINEKAKIQRQTNKMEVVPVEEKKLKKSNLIEETSKMIDKAMDKTAVSGDVYIIVRKGDSLSKIAKDMYGKSSLAILNAIKNRNPEIKDITLILIGQKIVLPILISVGEKITLPMKNTEIKEAEGAIP